MTPHESIEAYHRASKHELRRYAPGPGYLDWSTQPAPFRRYDGAARVELPLLADDLEVSFASVRAAAPVAAHAVARDNIALLLELSLALSAWKQYGAQRWALRCNPSSGNLHPTEAYVAVGDVPGLAAGVYHYCSLDHTLERRASIADAGWNAALERGVVVMLTSVHWREAWKYGLRAYRYCQHDVGHALAALAYAAAALGWQARLIDSWGDDDIAILTGVERDTDFPVEEEREAPDCALWIGAPGTALPQVDALRDSACAASWSGMANRLSAAHRQWPGIEEACHAARKQRTSPEANFVAPELATSAGSAIRIATLVRQRRSAVGFDASRSFSKISFMSMLEALKPRSAPPWASLPWEALIHPVFFVHRVDGLDPGIYAMARTPEAERMLRRSCDAGWLWESVPGAPAHLPLRLLARADARGAAQIISCRQDIAADGAFALGMLAEYRQALQRGPWWYRRLHWEAGAQGQVLYLEAEAAGVRGTGIGCFFDDEMHRLLGIEDESLQCVYHFTVGVPVEDTRLITSPPYGAMPGNEQR